MRKREELIWSLLIHDKLADICKALAGNGSVCISRDYEEDAQGEVYLTLKLSEVPR